MVKHNLTRPIAELAAEVTSGTLTASALVEESLTRIAAASATHAILETAAERARARAAEIDRRVAAGEAIGPLAGVPFIAKDNFLTAGTRTTAASRMLEPFQAPYQAVAIERLEAAGAIMVAKANLDAFAHGSSTENSDFGPTLNPHDPGHVPGGSSGGSGASVALGLAPFALGTDTGGSIRLPASYCGVVGLKPTYGLVPRTGVVAMASSFDVVGPLARSTADAALVLDVIAGRDASDATTIERDAAGYALAPVHEADSATAPLAGLRIGVIEQYLGAGLDPVIRASVETAAGMLRTAGATVMPVSLPATELALAAYYVLVPAEISSNLARYDGVKYGFRAEGAGNLEATYLTSRDQGFGREAKRRIMIGTYVLSSGYYDAYYKRAQRVRTRLIEQFEAAFADYDLLMGPTAPTPAFKLGDHDTDPLAMYLNDVCTVAVNLVGVPALSLPLGKADALPYGLQLIAPQRGERTLLGVAAACERLLGVER